MATISAAVYSKLYCPEDEAGWSARPSMRLLERLHARAEHEEGSARWICVLSRGEGEDDQVVRIALGDPVGESTQQERNLYVPAWLLESVGLEGIGEEMTVRFERSEDMPRATRLKLRILGDVPEDIDMRELLEEPLSQLGVLRTGQMLPAPVLEGLEILVEEAVSGASEAEEDAPVFLDGAEIALELETDAPALAPPVPVSSAPQEPEDFGLPIPLPMPSGGRSVGAGGPFVPFSGVGRRLCD